MISKVVLPLGPYDDIITKGEFSYVRVFPNVLEDHIELWEKKIDNSEPVLIEDVKASILEFAKQTSVNKINQYDVSPNVNSFTVNGIETWLDKATRVGLINSVNTLKALNEDTMTLWLNDVPYTVNVDTLQSLLISLEKYAIQCYNQTCVHLANIAAMVDPNEVQAYDYTTGYPEKLNITI